MVLTRRRAHTVVEFFDTLLTAMDRNNEYIDMLSTQVTRALDTQLEDEATSATSEGSSALAMSDDTGETTTVSRTTDTPVTSATSEDAYRTGASVYLDFDFVEEEEEEDENDAENMDEGLDQETGELIVLNDALLDWDFDTVHPELSQRFRTLVERIYQVTMPVYLQAGADNTSSKARATPTQLLSLPRLLYTRYLGSRVPKLEHHQHCSVCLGEFRPHTSITPLPCRHVFHERCIKGWLRHAAVCPMCKQDIDWSQVKIDESNLPPLRRSTRRVQ